MVSRQQLAHMTRQREFQRQSRIELACERYPLLALLTYPELVAYEPAFVQDIAAKFRSHSISPRQRDVVIEVLVAEAKKKTDREVALRHRREAELAGQVPPARAHNVRLRGLVRHIFTRAVGTPDERLMLWLDPDGMEWTLECTLPKSLYGVEPGDVVELTVKRLGQIKHNDLDKPVLAWGQYPAKAVRVRERTS